MLKPILIDSEAFVRERGQLQFDVALSDLDERVLSERFVSNDALLSCRIQGGVDALQRPYLALHLTGQLPLRCQRCLSAMSYELDERAQLFLFADESMLDAAMDADEELEGIVIQGELAVLPLIEDQLLISLPYAPLHENCNNPVLQRINQDKANPFTALSALKNNP